MNPKNVKTAMVDGREEVMYSAEGVAVLCFLAWREDWKPKARQFLEGYFRILANRRYGKGVSQIFEEVEAMGVSEGCDWIEATFKKYLNQSDIVNLMNGLTRGAGK